MQKSILLLGLSLIGSLSAEVLENDAMRIEFGDAKTGFAVERIVNRAAGDVNFLHATKSYPGLWGIRFVRKDSGTNVFVHVSNMRPAKSRKSSVAYNQAVFEWQGVSLPGSKGGFDVVAKVRLAPGSGMSEWMIAVDNASEVWTLYSIQYPFLDRVVTEDDPAAKVLTPAKANVGGRLLRMSEYKANTTLFSFAYPSDRLQMSALMTGDAGVYVAAHDPECRDKMLTVAPDGTTWFETLVENAGVPGKASGKPGYAVTVGCFRGDWWTAAHIYRDWALKQRWAAKGKIAFRKDYPTHATDTHLWVIGGGTGDYPKRTFAAMDRQWPNIGKSLTWSEWTAVGGGRATNRNNPEFFPAFPDIADLAKAQTDAGYLISIYINGRIWDKATCGFAYARQDATMKDDGSLHEEIYRSWGTNFHFGVMCPFCPTWQGVVKNLALRCLDELHMNAVYFDQISCSSSKACYNPAHGHPLGGGRWWEQGYRQMMSEVKREFVKRGAAVVSEQMGEMWLDLIDVYLNATAYTPYDVPLFPAVYSGYMVHYGRAVPLEASHDEAFREYARTIVWGEALGWMTPAILRDSLKSRSELVYKMASFRRDNKDFLVLGTLENEVRFTTPDKDVFGCIYRDATGEKSAAFVVNAAKIAKTVDIIQPNVTRKFTLEPQSIQKIEGIEP